MAKGTVKWFNPKKGFGFVVNEDGVDVFVHYTKVIGSGFRSLKTGQEVEYIEFDSSKGLQGSDVRIIRPVDSNPDLTPPSPDKDPSSPE